MYVWTRGRSSAGMTPASAYGVGTGADLVSGVAAQVGKSAKAASIRRRKVRARPLLVIVKVKGLRGGGGGSGGGSGSGRECGHSIGGGTEEEEIDL